MKNFVNEIADCQYSFDSTFSIIISSKERYAYFGHSQEEYEMMDKYGISLKIRKPNIHKIYITRLYLYMHISIYMVQLFNNNQKLK